MQEQTIQNAEEIREEKQPVTTTEEQQASSEQQSDNGKDEPFIEKAKKILPSEKDILESLKQNMQMQMAQQQSMMHRNDPTVIKHKMNRLRSLIPDKRYLSKFKKLDEFRSAIPPYILATCKKPSTILVDKTSLRLNTRDKYIFPFDMYMATERSRFTRHKILKPHRQKIDRFWKPFTPGMDLSGKKVLFILNDGITNFITCQPVINKLKEDNPKSHFILATLPIYKQFIEKCWPDPWNDVITLPFTLDWLVGTDMHINLSWLFENCIEANFMNMYDAFDIYLNGKETVDMTLKKNLPQLRLDKSTAKEVKAKVKDLIPYIIVHVRPGTPTKAISYEKWKEILRGLVNYDVNLLLVDTEDAIPSIKPVLIDGLFPEMTPPEPSEDENAEEGEEKPKKPVVENLKAVDSIKDYHWTLPELVALVRYSEGVIGVNSALVHLAAVQRKKFVAITSSFTVQSTIHYYEGGLVILPSDKKEAKCKFWPCHLHRHERHSCPSVRDNAEELECFEFLDVNEVINESVKYFGLSLKQAPETIEEQPVEVEPPPTQESEEIAEDQG